MLCMVKVDKQKELLIEFESVTKEFMDLISSFSQEQINTIPFEGSWTAAQVAEHIIKSDTGMIKILYGPTKQTTRQPDENIESLKAQFLDFTTKLESPKFIIPASVAYDKETLLNSLRRTRIKINEAIKTLDAGATCPGPVLGELTRLEIFNFIIFHTQRHIHQLKNIFQKVDNE